TNNAASSATSGNTGTTTQNGAQNQSGSSCLCTGKAVQAVGQSAHTHQGALAESAAMQLARRAPCGCGSIGGHSNGEARNGSSGDGGSVSQLNNAGSSSIAGNTGTTSQSAGQMQAGGCGCSGSRVQATGQVAPTKQHARGTSLALQGAPANASGPA